MPWSPTAIREVLVQEPELAGDARGFFFESFNQREFDAAAGGHHAFVQDNHSRSLHGVLRGLHYQVQHTQGKLVRVVNGAIFDVAVDLRRSSGTFGQWVGVELSAENQRQMWVPPGFAHGLLVLSPFADVLYKTTAYYAPEHQRSIAWNDADLAIDWPLGGCPAGAPHLSLRDQQAVPFRAAQCFD